MKSFAYDKANQLVTSTVDEKVTNYAYDAAGRLVKEGSVASGFKTYSYGYLDKILEVQENGEQIAAFDYHVGGQIASAVHGDKTENFIWDGLALIHRGDNSFINEPYVTGGNPILSSKDGVMFNDMLGTTLGVKNEKGFDAISMTAFGQPTTSQPNNSTTEIDKVGFFTGKPYIGELGYAFLFRNYRANQGKWQTKDPLGYPDGWNQFAYVNNHVTDNIDYLGAWTEPAHHDINEIWLTSNNYDTTIALGGETIDILQIMNDASDWSDSLSNQVPSKAYIHAMRSTSDGSPENIAQAKQAYDNYLNKRMSVANDYIADAEHLLSYGMTLTALDSLALDSLALAFSELGKLVHTLSDSLSPSHAGFQYFDLQNSVAHLYAERYSVYLNDYKDIVNNKLNSELRSVLDKIMKVAE
ncbi:MAG: hypothetical protein PHS31_06245 [Victivallaceae bacterium]|nr:hypothetical protein [Victivallaceae bacterium]